MWLFTFHVIPKPESPEAKLSGGAYVNCWIDFPQQDGAENLAKFYIEQDEQWIIENLEETSLVEATDYKSKNPNKKFFLEAVTDGYSIVFHHYPIEE